MYDPLGFICPYILKGRIYFQLVNKSKIEWKQNIPQEILKPFENWKKNVHHLKNLKIPRWTSTLGMENAKAELVIFCDASATGYGMVAYVRRVVVEGEKTHVAFLTAKSHVVPVKMLQEDVNGQQCHADSIPRLELCAAKLAAIWRDILIRESGETFTDITMFSDSQTVLNWIGNWTSKFRTFENFRLKKIRMLSKVSEWRFVPTKINPADVTSKGLEANNEKGWKLFHDGPTFLKQDKADWPDNSTMSEAEQHVENVQIAATSAATIDSLTASALSTPVELLAIGATEKEPEIEIERPEGVEVAWPLTATKNISSWTAKVRRVAIIVKTMLKWRAKCTKSRIAAYDITTRSKTKRLKELDEQKDEDKVDQKKQTNNTTKKTEEKITDESNRLDEIRKKDEKTDEIRTEGKIEMKLPVQKKKKKKTDEPDEEETDRQRHEESTTRITILTMHFISFSLKCSVLNSPYC